MNNKAGASGRGAPGEVKRRGAKNPIRTIGKVLRFVVGDYPVRCILVLICLIASAVGSAYGTMFFKTLITDFIEPMLVEKAHLDSPANGADEYIYLADEKTTLSYTVDADTLKLTVSGAQQDCAYGYGIDGGNTVYPDAADGVIGVPWAGGDVRTLVTVTARDAAGTETRLGEFFVNYDSGRTFPTFSDLARQLVSVILFYMVSVLAVFGSNSIMVTVTQGTLKKIRDRLFEHMEKLPIRYFDRHPHGDIMSIYTNDTDTLRQLISQSIPNMISSAATVVASVTSMIILSPVLTLIAMSVVVFAVIITRRLGGRSAKYFRATQGNLGALNGFIEEMAEGQKVIKVFNREAQTTDEFDCLNDELYKTTKNANALANIVMPIMGNLGYLNYVLVAIVGGAFAISNFGGFTIAALVPFLQFTRTFNMPISQFSQQINSIIMAMAGAERIFTLLNEPVEGDEGYVTLVNATEKSGTLVECEERTGTWAWKHPHKADGTVTYTKLCGDVVFEDVDFGYTDEKMVLRDISLYARPGHKVAFVGATGAGKTTITNLINRFYDIQSGKIRYDGININKIKKDDLRRSLGVVLQDTHLFTGTVRENIRYGKLDATDEEVVAAATLANADYFIRHLPQGYDTMITADGANLSQGQRQLLSIARAAVADPPVLILDEATSSIDTRTEAIVAAGMDSLMYGRTVFVIAHRLSTVKNADVIMVLEHGRIIERGSHDSLIEQRGKYYQLYTGKKE